jgi:hypothetical protein
MIIAKAGGSFKPAPAGTHAAVCCDVIDLGPVQVTFQNKTRTQHKVIICWQLAELMDDGKPFLVRRRYTCSLHEKAALRKDLESWRGKAFTQSELEAFDLENLLGAGCLINVIHEQRNGSTYANVASVMKMPKSMAAPSPQGYVRVCDRPPAQTNDSDNENEFGISDSDIPF